MSKLVKIDITCPHCRQQYSDRFFRTYWGEDEGSRTKLMNDEVNIATCPHCGHRFHLPLAMMYVDVHSNIAVWWEPQHDAGIDSDARGYAQMFGAKSFYATAPRIADWEEFKRTINRYYCGELVGGPIEKMDFATTLKKAMENEKQQQQPKGCMGMVAVFILCTAAVVALL